MTTYFLRNTSDGKVIHTVVLGEATPLALIAVKNRLINHKRDVNHYSRADPDRAAAEQALADELEGLLAKMGIVLDT